MSPYAAALPEKARARYYEAAAVAGRLLAAALADPRTFSALAEQAA